MRAYKIITGTRYIDFCENRNGEKAEYFLDKEKALARYVQGEYEIEECEIISWNEDGTKFVSHTYPTNYERELKNARPNEEVKIVKNKYNRFRMEEIEIEE